MFYSKSTKKKIVIGYTAGVFDLFHIGHINILKRAKSMCDKLIVGVSSDSLVYRYKKKKPIIKYKERSKIVSSVKFVDHVIKQNTLDKLKLLEKYKFDIMFVGDDWFKTSKWKKIESDFNIRGVKIIYFPYTKGTSSTKVNNILNKFR